MTLFSRFSFLKISRNSINNFKTMNAAALMVFLFVFLTSTIAHADHLVDQQKTLDKQACQLCNQGIDTPPDLPQVQASIVTYYHPLNFQLTTTEFIVSEYIQPFLRAPPIFQ